jgi:tRNA(Arg) A34 adenosine deaminase TadA
MSKSQPLPPSAGPQPSFLHKAIHLAIEGVNSGHGGPFGAVIVKEGQIIGRGCNRVTSTNDPTAHAEIVAIRDACQTLGVYHLTGCELYASCEPCPMCLAAIYWARLERCYFAARAAEAAAAGFSDEFIREQFALAAQERSLSTLQLLHAEAAAPFEAWHAKHDRLPY